MKNITPIFSIVLPTHNRAHLLDRAVKSCLAQTFADFELILIDDGSTDNTQALINSYTDPRICSLPLAIAKGVSQARNQGILKASGKYIAFLDDDDEYLPNFLAATHRALQTSANPTFSWCGIQRIFSDGKQQDQLWDLSEKEHRQTLKFTTQFSASHGLTVARAALLDIGLFDEQMTASEDIDLLLRLLEKNYSYTTVPEVLLKLYIHQGPSLSRTQNQTRFAFSNQRLIEKNTPFLARHPLVWLHYHGVLMGNYYRSKQYSEARKTAWKILKKFPFHTKTWEKIVKFECIQRFKKKP
jgi:glycosyltransferase involved in cell wall biosynthesis